MNHLTKEIMCECTRAGDPIHLFINDLILRTEVNTRVHIYPVQFSTLTTTNPFPVRD